MRKPIDISQMELAVLDTPLGGLLLGSSTRGVTLVHFVGAKLFPGCEAVSLATIPHVSLAKDGKGHYTVQVTADMFKKGPRQGAAVHLWQAVQDLCGYFSGTEQSFSCKIYPFGTRFQEQVWQYLTTIPYGETTTYSAVAQGIGRPKAVRAVAGAIGRNPIGIIIPCHRVIGKDGSLTGFAGGLERKEALLRLEQSGSLAG